MKLIFINRKTDRILSIEKVFNIVKRGLDIKLIYVDWFAPSKFNIPTSIFKNCIYYLYKRLFFSKRADIFHIKGSLHYLFFVLPKNRSVLTIHDCGKAYQHQGLKRWIAFMLWYKLPTKYFSHITVVSNQTKSELINITNCNPEKINVIYNPVDPDIIFVPKEFNKDKPIILHIGTTKNKNLDRLIMAIDKISCKLIIVGKVENDIQKLLLQYKIEFEQYYNCSEKEIRQLYLRADIVSFVTIYEGFGMPIIEAQASGRIVLTSNIEPHKEIGGCGALYVNPFSIQEINSGIKEIISNDTVRENIINKGRINVQRFQFDEIANHYYALYEKLFKQLT